MKDELIKVKGTDGKEYFSKIIKCSSENCTELATTHLTQDDKFYCDKHGQEEVGNFIGAINSLGGFV